MSFVHDSFPTLFSRVDECNENSSIVLADFFFFRKSLKALITTDVLSYRFKRV